MDECLRERQKGVLLGRRSANPLWGTVRDTLIVQYKRFSFRRSSLEQRNVFSRKLFFFVGCCCCRCCWLPLRIHVCYGVSLFIPLVFLWTDDMTWWRLRVKYLGGLKAEVKTDFYYLSEMGFSTELPHSFGPPYPMMRCRFCVSCFSRTLKSTYRMPMVRVAWTKVFKSNGGRKITLQHGFFLFIISLKIEINRNNADIKLSAIHFSWMRTKRYKKNKLYSEKEINDLVKTRYRIDVFIFPTFYIKLEFYNHADRTEWINSNSKCRNRFNIK